MSEINHDKDVLDNRKALLTKEQQVPLRDQIVKKLFKKLEEMEIGTKVASLWSSANSDRSQWMDRQVEFLSHYDEFIDVPPAGYFDNSANLRIPMTLWILRTYHARFFQSMFSPEPSLSIKGRKELYNDLASEIELFMKYALLDWANRRRGVEEAVDQWLWSWASTGIGYLKDGWDCQYRKFLDVEEVQEVGPFKFIEGSNGQQVAIPDIKIVEKEVERVNKVWEGPRIDFVPIEDIVVVGPDMSDIDGADAVIHRQFLTASDLWLLVDRGIFDKEAVENIIEGGNDSADNDVAGLLKSQRAQNAGSAGTDKDYDHDRYEILEAYLSIDVDGTGINSEVIVWVHNKTKGLLRATYLNRVNKSGERPISAILFHKRGGGNDQMPIGLVEMLYPLQKELDAHHNLRVDFGIISTCPIGFYRASSSLDPKAIKIQPGMLIPLDNPQTDINFPQMGNRTSFGANEEQIILTYVERLTGMNDLNFGANSGRQGAARTATGVQAMVGESNSNLNILLKRMNRGWKRVLEHLLHGLQQRTPPGFEFRVTGEDGLSKYMRVVDQTQLYGEFDIEVTPTTEASNKQIQIQNALQMVQLTSNPLDIQLGIVTAANRYEALRAYLRTIGVKDVSKYINAQFANQVTLAPKETVERILLGQDVQINPQGDLQGVVALIQEYLGNDEIMGTLSPQQAMLLQAHMGKAQQMLAALQQAQSNQAAAQQMQFNSANGSQQTSPGGPVGQAPPAFSSDNMGEGSM